MKRYWKLIILALVIVGSLTTFFTKLAYSKSAYPQLIIKTLQGEPKACESVQLSGSYSASNFSDSFTLDCKGMTYRSSQAFWALPGMGSEPIIFKPLIKKYHHFMRGKALVPNFFYENGTRLVYAVSNGTINEPSENVLKVGLLNKRTKKEITFSLSIKTDAAYLMVSDVQMEGNLLEVVGQGPYRNGGMAIEVLTVDPTKQTLVKDEVIREIDPQTNKTTVQPDQPFLSVVTEANPFKSNPMVVLVKQDQSGRNRTLASYNLLSGMKTPLTLPKGIPSSATLVGLEGRTLYLMEQSKNRLSFYSYNVESGKEEGSYQVDVGAIPMSSRSGFTTTLYNGRLYIVTPYVKGKGSTLFILDARNGNTLYKGQIEERGHAPIKGDLQLYGIAPK